ncbi:MAG: hypothetical protein ACRETG_02940, partial [Steroidobacteraceae bacterium]
MVLRPGPADDVPPRGGITRPDRQPAPQVTALRALARPPVPAVSAAELWAGVHLPGPDPGEKLRRLALCAQRFTPRVSLAAPDGLLLEVKGSLHLFAGVAGLRAAIAGECQRLGLPFVLAFAPTPLAALAMARGGKPLAVMDLVRLTGLLAPLPLSTLRWP